MNVRFGSVGSSHHAGAVRLGAGLLPNHPLFALSQMASRAHRNIAANGAGATGLMKEADRMARTGAYSGAELHALRAMAAGANNLVPPLASFGAPLHRLLPNGQKLDLRTPGEYPLVAHSSAQLNLVTVTAKIGGPAGRNELELECLPHLIGAVRRATAGNGLHATGLFQFGPDGKVRLKLPSGRPGDDSGTLGLTIVHPDLATLFPLGPPSPNPFGMNIEIMFA